MPLLQKGCGLFVVQERSAPEYSPSRVRIRAYGRFSLAQEIAGDIGKSGEHGCFSLRQAQRHVCGANVRRLLVSPV